MKKKQWVSWLIGGALLGNMISIAAAPAAATKESVEITADQMDYNWNSGEMIAEGNVLALRQGDELRGDRLEYNVNTESGSVIGNVVATRTNGSKMVTARLDLDGGVLFTGSGGVHYTSPTGSVQAPWVQYNTETGFIRSEGRTTLIRPDGTVKADRVEAWERSNQLIAQGNVDFVSDLHQTVGRSDRLDYAKGNSPQGTLIFTGHAQVVQQGKNMLTGPKITIDLDTGEAQAEGRPTLVITPNK